MRPEFKFIIGMALCACGSQESPRTSLLLAASTSLPVSRTITIFASVQGEPVRSLQLMRGEQTIASLAPPYAFVWDTADEIEGTHVLFAEATNTSGQKVRSNPLDVTVDRTGPQVSQVSPAPGPISAAVSPQFIVGFSEPILRSSVGPESALLQDASGPRLPASVTLAPDGRSLIVTPAPPLPSLRRSLSLHVASTLTDRAGNPLRAPPADFGWVLAATPLAVQSLQHRLGTNGIELWWQPPLDDGGAPVLTYRIRQYAPAASDVIEIPALSNTLWWVGLQNHRTVAFGVAAVSAIGEGPEARTPALPIAYEEPVLVYQRAVALFSGKILVVGGTDGQRTVPAALYDPATEKMTPAGAGEVLRLLPATARLGDGRVLIAGGFGADARITQIYDPVKDRFVGSPPLLSGRSQPAVAELPDGRVLLAGGVDPTPGVWTEMASAEIFDPAKADFDATGSMIEGRIAPATAVLPGGKVLVAGGWVTRGDGMSASSSAEVWDPATGRFALTGSLSAPRALATATVLGDGRVLVIGLDSTIEAYDPSSGRFTTVGRTLQPRSSHTATLLPDGRVLIAGGSGDPGVEIFDPASGISTAAPPLRIPRFQHTESLLPGGKVLMLGGYYSLGPGYCAPETYAVPAR